MIIPPQLKNQRFIKVDANKRPIEKDWQKEGGANYSLTDEGFIKQIEALKMYGVLCGVNNLIVIDFDDDAVQNEAEALGLLPETFTVKTARKGLHHLYFFVDNAESWKVLDKEKATIADIQGRGKQVVGPGTVLADGSGRRYEIVKDLPIATIKVDLIHRVLDRYDYSKNQEKLSKTEQSLTLDDFQRPKINDNSLEEIKRLMKVSDVLKDAGISTNKNPTKCPMHDSKGGKCFGFDDSKGVWHCFHCDEKGDVITLWQNVHGVQDFVEAKKQLCEELGIEDTYHVAINEANTKPIDTTKSYETLMKEQYVQIVVTKKFGQDIITRIAKILVNHYKFVTVKETDVIFSYHPLDGIYKPDGEVIIKTELEKFFDNKCKTDAVNEIVNKVKRLTYNTIEVFTKNDLKKICMLNGVYDMENFTLVPFSPSYYFINRFPIKYDSSKDCPRIKKFMGEIVHKEHVETLWELFGWTLMNDYRIQRAVMLIGSGRNGKSVYLHLLKSFLGAENVSNQSIQNLSDDKFATFNLFGKLANIYSDLSSEEIKDTSTFKTLTSGMDAIRAEQKFKDQFSFVNKAKLLFSCNQIPKTSDVSDAFFRRWVIIIFPFKFEGKNENKNLVTELVDEGEMSGLFNLAIEKYKALQVHEDFTTNQSVDDVREMYTRLSDPIGSFILDKLSVMSDAYLPKEDVYTSFISYCRDHKFPTISEKMFSGLMFTKLPVTHFRATYTRSDGKTERVMCWKGISWKQLDEEDIIKEFKIGGDD